MSWYKTGTITITNGSAAVVGASTLFVDNGTLNAGDMLYAPDGKFYEILSIQSNTGLTLASNYLGVTASGAAYAIVPVGLLPSALAQQVKSTLATANTALASAVLSNTNTQGLTGTQQQNARTNIAALGAADVGQGFLSLSVAGNTDVTLTAAQAANLFIELTGTLTGNINVIVPAPARDYFFYNGTTGSYTLTVKTASGTGVAIAQNARVELECNGTNVINPFNQTPLNSPVITTPTLVGSGGVLTLPAGPDTLVGQTYLSQVLGINLAVNSIGTPGAPGFGVGICPLPTPGLTPMPGCAEPASDTYGNYQFTDGSVMVWIPAFYYKWGTGSNGFAINWVDIQPESAYASVSAANTAGYALHRAFYDNGAVTRGFMVDKFKCSNNGGIASSIKNGNPLSSNSANNPFSGLTGAPANFYYGAIAAAKTRGSNFFPSSLFIRSAIAMLSYAHAQASTTTTWCAWYNAINNFPKGCNNNALGDANDGALTFVSAGNGTYPTANKTGSANVLAKTTHNGQNSGVVDVNGTIWEIALGLASDGTNYYILNTAAQMKSLTAGNTLSTDAWGAAGLSANYTSLGATFGALTASSTVKYFGSSSQVFDASTTGNAWNATGAGIPLVGGTGGTNQFGQDGLWDYRPVDMCPLVAGYWGNSSYAGVWALYLYPARGDSNYSVGLRAALYL